MKTKHGLVLVAMSAALFFCARVSAQTTFYFQFNALPFQLGAPPVVGDGTFTFATFPGDGTFPISDLGAFTASFNFSNGDSFSQADIVSDLSDVEVSFSTYLSTVTRLQFSDTGAGGGGSPGGSLDFLNASELLSFEPSDSSYGSSLELYKESDATGGMLFGDYLATSVPLTSVPDKDFTIWYLGLACFALAAATKRLSPKMIPIRLRAA